MNDFYLTLPSNTTVTNTTAKFSVHLPHKLSLQGSWEVALSEIQYPYSWNNIHGLSQADGRKDNRIDVTFRDYTTIPLYIPINHYDTIQDLLTAIEYAKKTLSRTIKRELKKHSNSTQLDINYVKDLLSGFTLTYDETLKRIQCKIFTEKVHSIKLSERLQYMLGFAKNKIKKSKLYGKFQPDLHGGFYSLYIYCSLVEPQIVGNITAPLLRTVHIEGIHGEIIEKLYHSPHYVSVIAKEIDRVEIDIKDDNNHYVPFQFGKSVVKLHFRKKRAVLM